LNLAGERNVARFFVENREIGWVALAAVCAWGVYGYINMPRRRDPQVANKQAAVVTVWPGEPAERIEQLVTKPIEKAVASNSSVARIESVSRSSVSVVTFALQSHLTSTGQTLDDIGGRLAALSELPAGAGPPGFIRDFGETATLLLTVASPQADSGELALRANGISQTIIGVRPRSSLARASLVLCFPIREDRRQLTIGMAGFIASASQQGLLRDAKPFDGPGFAGLDFVTDEGDATLAGALEDFIDRRYHRSELPPDSWAPFVVRDPSGTLAALTSVAAEKYSYRDLDEYTGLIERALLAAGRTPDDPPLVAKVTRSGLLQERVYVTYSQEQLASHGIRPDQVGAALSASNIPPAGGEIDIAGKSIGINASGEAKSEQDLGLIPIGTGQNGAQLYLRDLASIARGYQNPPSYLAFHSSPDSRSVWRRSRAITLSVQMGAGQNIGKFGKAVTATLQDVLSRLPGDLIVERTSDQPEQVGESIRLFMTSLNEAVLLVVLISAIGFWEWRAALLMALAIPITLFMTFGMMEALGLDFQQVSIAALIIALGLLIDDPVVAGDAIQRDLASYPPAVACWRAPTRLSAAILFATITNIVAYLPFLLLTGRTGQFIYSLPMVIACSLVASRVVSMTFIPLLALYILKRKKSRATERAAFAGWYRRTASFAIAHRKAMLAASLLILAAGVWIGANLGQQFFPNDLSHLAYVNVTLPEGASFELTRAKTEQVENAIRRVAGDRHVTLRSLNSFVGGSAPRFWYALAPEENHRNFAQIVISGADERGIFELLPAVQEKVLREIAGAIVDVSPLETGDEVGIPIKVRISGDNIPALRNIAGNLKDLLRTNSDTERIRDDWGDDRFDVELAIDRDRANLAGVSNLDVASSSFSELDGAPLTYLREGSRQIPVVSRLRADERAQLSDIDNLYVYSASGAQKIPLREIAHVDYSLRTETIRRRNQYRTLTVSAAPRAGILASSIMKGLMPRLTEIESKLPTGYRLEIGGEKEKQDHGNQELNVVLAVSVVAIYLALAVQFRSSLKPLLVLAAVPYGMVGALAALYLTDTPFGFMAFLGVISLVGVIVSHIIVLFDCVEEKRREGDPFEKALLDAVVIRLRPVLITVAATVAALVPLALHGGPLWEPMCYSQIGGLIAATPVTLLIVPVLYSTFVLDLRIVRWNETTLPVTHELMEVSPP
jgi:multidrug efflux pump subunit AcrB